MANDIKKALETTQTELKTAREKNSALEKECVIYKSQLEVTACIHVLHVFTCIYLGPCTILGSSS